MVVTRLMPWIRIGKNYAWIVSLAVGKSRRQINDWLLRRTRKKSVQRLDKNLTGLGGNFGQAIAVRHLQLWLNSIPEGDMLVFRCESAKPEKQMKVWNKWISKHHPDIIYSVDENLKSFYFYKSHTIE